jgi:Cu-Zn family superoxide dismutase
MKNLSLLIVFALFLNCSSREVEVEEINTEPIHTKAVSVVHQIGDSGVSGVVEFRDSGNGVNVTAEISGLEPGMHGFHIHTYGDCTASDGTSAGGHFNPTDNEHSSPDAEDRHMGDMGNITANEDGIATIDYVDETISMDQIIGRGIILHAGEDDLTSQPSGAAGARIGCGVIGIQE